MIATIFLTYWIIGWASRDSIKTIILLKLDFVCRKSTIMFMQIMNNVKFEKIYENEIKSIEEII